MSDDIAVTPGAGAAVATDEVLGRHYQQVKIVTGEEGTVDGPVSAANPMPTREVGELVEALEAMRMAMQAMLRTFGMTYPDVGGRLRVAIDAISASLTLATITTVGTVSTVTTVATMTNQTNIGGVSAAPQVPALTMIAAESLRRNISVTP